MRGLFKKFSFLLAFYYNFFLLQKTYNQKQFWHYELDAKSWSNICGIFIIVRVSYSSIFMNFLITRYSMRNSYRILSNWRTSIPHKSLGYIHMSAWALGMCVCHSVCVCVFLFLDVCRHGGWTCCACWGRPGHAGGQTGRPARPPSHSAGTTTQNTFSSSWHSITSPVQA